MAKVKITQFDGTSAAGSGISISLSETRAGQYIRINITVVAQTRYFGGAFKDRT